MAPRSYAQIIWRKQRLGLLMVNDSMQSDFVFASLIIEMCNHPGEYRVIKQRDRRPDRAIGYHPGEMWGAYEDNECTSILTLYLWPVGQKAFVNEKTKELCDCLTHQYLFPCDEFQSFRHVLESMQKQKETFDDLQSSILTTPGFF